MKKYLLTSVFVFFACVIALNAQENQEKKKVHLKIIKEENDKITEIDTVFEGTDKEGLHYFGDIDGKDINIDSILKEFKIEGHEGMKFMTISDKYHSKDSLKHVWHTINADVEGDPVKMKKMIFISEDGDKKLIESKEGMVFVHSDCDSDDEHVFIHGDGKKVKIIKKEIGDSMVWISEEEGVHKITDDGNVFIYKTGDKTFDIIKSEDGENQIIKEFIVKKNGEIEKTIEIMVTEDGDYSIVKIIGDDDDLMHAEENVKIYKYKTDDGKITVKAEITDSEKGEKKKIKKEFKKIKISPNPTDGKFNLEFELSNKESVVIKVNNESGKSVYSKKVKKFTGTFSEEIDISKEESGTYYILITQGDKTIKNKIVKN